MATRPPPPHAAATDNTMLHVVYGLFALSFLIGIAAIAAVIVAYLQRGKPLSDMSIACSNGRSAPSGGAAVRGHRLLLPDGAGFVADHTAYLSGGRGLVCLSDRKRLALAQGWPADRRYDRADLSAGAGAAFTGAACRPNRAQWSHRLDVQVALDDLRCCEQRLLSPVQTIRPFSMTTWRSARRASASTFLSTIRMAMPVSLMVRRQDQMVSRTRGARPLGCLVQHQEGRVGRERATDRQHLLLAAGKLASEILRRS